MGSCLGGDKGIFVKITFGCKACNVPYKLKTHVRGATLTSLTPFLFIC